MTPSSSAAQRDAAGATPSFVERSRPLVARLLRLGMPMGPNALLTVRGRKTGTPRTVPVAVLQANGREFVFAAFGETAWVQNLRAAGTATIRRGRAERPVRAVEVDPADAAQFLEIGLRSVLRFPVLGSMIAGWYGIDRRSSTADYEVSARRHPAFELTPLHAGTTTGS
jgi:deazaflavin-dependent oxidoreductase (nitroreductase family)